MDALAPLLELPAAMEDYQLRKFHRGSMSAGGRTQMLPDERHALDVFKRMRTDAVPRCLLSVSVRRASSRRRDSVEVTELYDHALVGDAPEDGVSGPIVLQLVGGKRVVDESVAEKAKKRRQQHREEQPATFQEYAKDALDPTQRNDKCVYCVEDPDWGAVYFCRSCLVSAAETLLAGS